MRFNLIIEILLIHSHNLAARQFQSRYRFNLIIEILLIHSGDVNGTTRSI